MNNNSRSNITQDGSILNMTIFNTDHFPVGTAVLLSSEDGDHACIIIGYHDLDRVMMLVDVETYDNNCHFEITPDHVFGDDAKFHLTRLLPEPPELENMDYESALKEMT